MEKGSTTTSRERRERKGVLANYEQLLNPFIDALKKNVNIVVATTNAGAGHWRQAERLVRLFTSLGLEDQITFIVTDRTTGETKSLSDIILRLYPTLQKTLIGGKIMELLAPFMNSRLGLRIIDRQLAEMARHGEEDIKRALESSETFSQEKPTIFLTTHSMLAGAVSRLVQERKNPDDWVVEFPPDPWEGADLYAMTVKPPDRANWITVVHDKKTAEEYRRVRPTSSAIVVPWGTLSNAVFLERRRQIERGEEPKRKTMDVLIECSGNEIPPYDNLIIEFIKANVQAIKEGKIRLVIEPMHHQGSHKRFLKVLQETDLLNNPHIFLLPAASDRKTAVERREDVIEGKNEEVKNKFNNSFDPFIVIAKGGEVPVEDRADMIVFCPYASVPHEVRDIEFGVREGRAVDARRIPPDQWFDKLKELYEQETRLPEASLALLAPALIYIANHPEVLEKLACELQEALVKLVPPELLIPRKLQEIMPYFIRKPEAEKLSEQEIIALEQKLLELAGFETMTDFLQEIKDQTVVITLIAGAGTRWTNSFDQPDNSQLIKEYQLGKDEPRALANVDNLLSDKISGNQLPIAAYNLLAVQGLGQQVIIYGGETDEKAGKNLQLIKERLTDRLGISDSTVFVRQRLHPNQEKPLGHGDALMQFFDSDQGKKILKGKKFVLVNFGADPNSYQTAVLTLLSMYVFDKYNAYFGGIIPTSVSDEPPYPIYMNEDGLPIGTSHEKDELPPPENASKTNQSNVGIRVFRIEDLKKAMAQYQEIYEKIAQGGEGISYPDGELKVDHFERWLMDLRKILTVPISLPEEIAHTPKVIEEISFFLEDMKEVLRQDQNFKGRHI